MPISLIPTPLLISSNFGSEVNPWSESSSWGKYSEDVNEDDLYEGKSLFFNLILLRFNVICVSHLDPPANGQAVIHLTGLLEVFISELSINDNQSDNDDDYVQ